MAPIDDPAHVDNLVVASFAQEAMWLHGQLNSQKVRLHNLLWQLRLSGPLDPTRLAAAVQAVVNRHDSLRSSFLVKHDRLFRVACSQMPVPCVMTDLSLLPEADVVPRALHVSREFGHAVFDIEKPPLVRCLLLKLSAEEHRLLVSFHHLITDGTSWPIFLRDLVGFYAGESLPSLATDYGEYATSERKSFERGAWEEHRAYWRAEFRDGVLPQDIPLQRLRTNEGHSFGGVHEELLPAALKDGLRAVATQYQTSPFRVLLASFVVLLHRLTGNEQVVVSTALAGRTDHALASLIGLFVNLAPIQCEFEDDPTFSTVLNAVHRRLDDAVRHQAYPYHMVLQEVKASRERGNDSLVPVSFTKLPPTLEIQVGQLRLRDERVFMDVSQGGLSVYTHEEPEGLRLICEYASDQFSDSSVRRLADHFKTLVQSVVANPVQTVESIPLITEHERHQVLVEWNQTSSERSGPQCVHQLFEARSERNPDQTAVIWGDYSLTYGELNTRASRFAHHLRGRGVGVETPVGLCVKRSLDLPIALLGILKAGGAYVPIDPNYPSERALFMLDESRAPLLVTQESFREQFAGFEGSVVTLDGPSTSFTDQPTVSPRSTVSGDNLAYVIFTSGSTGKPKGVAVIHSSVVNHNLVVSKAFELTPDDRVLQFASFAFDTAVEEIFPTWNSGATLVLPATHALMTAQDFADFIDEYRISVLDLPTQYWFDWTESLLEMRRPLPSTVRLVAVGGERATARQWDAWMRLTRGKRVWINGYGPTETTVISTLIRTTGLTEGWGESDPPIGRPIANTYIYILDRKMQPVPVGVAGELYIGGAGVARGYLNRPELTAERFLPDPFRSEPGARMYRTGDLARYDESGDIHCIGRADQQVKIRGFRVEPGEIETALMKHFQIREAVVAVREDKPGNKRLVAYLVSRLQPPPSSEQLRTFLRRSLPDYLVPATFVLLDALPLTSSGKVNRRALPAPDTNRPEFEEAYAAPKLPLERGLERIWASALDVERVGIDDNFFDLGGDSLIAVGLFSRINAQLGVNVPLASLLQAPTIRQLATLIPSFTDARALDPAVQGGAEGEVVGRQRAAAPQWRCLVPIQQNGAAQPLFLCHAVGGNVLNYAVLVQHLGVDQPVYGLQARGLDGLTPPFPSIETMATQFIQDIRLVQAHGPYRLGGGSFGGIVAYEMARQLERLGETSVLVALFDTACPDSRTSDTATVDEVIKGMMRGRAYPTGSTRYGRVIRTLLHSVSSRTSDAIKQVACIMYGRLRRPIPLSLRTWHITSHNRAILAKYRVGPYGGTIRLFRTHAQSDAGSSQPCLGWSAWAKAVTIDYIQADHFAFVESPELGKRLDTALRETR